MSTHAGNLVPKFSKGTDEATLAQELQTLLASADGGAAAGRWHLSASGEGLERSFRFKTFAKTWDFMTAVALQCKLKNHHPEWSNVYNTVFIRWATHSPKGLSAQDVELATICDGLASAFGELAIEEGGNSGSSASCDLGRRLADMAATNAGDCCTPKKPTAQ
ncbi:pterin 4 alpha carbinolamine dehydratase-domain-containing protein [Xylariales sp. PMI_506]|nr:pterin 4 alpha carbinolamine dehydratase-domain-containing protein [Xylariales sp. PMI_506]